MPNLNRKGQVISLLQYARWRFDYVLTGETQSLGTAKPCFVSSLLDELEGTDGINKEDEEDVKGLGLGVYSGEGLWQFHAAGTSS